MLLLKSQTRNPYFNIATEEFLLKNRNENILFLYKNTPAVIIGKHQIHNLEVNIPYVIRNQTPVIRRISGGGSVFHDSENLNYAIISSQGKAWVDFELFTKPLIFYLRELGLNPELRSKSDIRINGKKISGNASHIYKKRILHHGSILFNTNLEQLTTALKNKPSCYQSQTVNSRRSIVTNIASHLQTPLLFQDFEKDFIAWLHKNKTITQEITLSNSDKEAINKLIEDKYQTSEWNVAYNANYSFKNTFLHDGNIAQLTLEVRKGICKNTMAKGMQHKDIQQLTKNVPHGTYDFCSALKDIFREEDILTHFF